MPVMHPSADGSTLKVCASEQELSLLKLLQRAQPKLNNAVVNPKPSTLNPQPSTLNPQPSKALHVVETLVVASLGEQRLMCATLDNLTFV